MSYLNEWCGLSSSSEEATVELGKFDPPSQGAQKGFLGQKTVKKML